ncbi:MAG: LacI family DNA-binding transcriptional regulator [Lachnospiraceae bacterium]|nr:LacI family DNA-binding transcriptional regulator [bacterium]MDY5518298.1 LacI family DNA-binding transcriptional regulator [Lachnospiraceae bacterium]
MEPEENKNITIADVAEALGVSKTTVSRAISGKGRIGEATRERVLSYIREHDYQPNVIAKGLAQSKTFNLCVVMPEHYGMSDLTFFQDCLFGIEKISGTVGYDVLICICNSQDISSLERIISNHKVDGVLLMCSYVKDAQVEFLQEKGVPFLTIGSSNYSGVIQVDHDHRSACRELTELMILKGLERIALIGGNETHMVTKTRYAGFCDAYEQYGREIDPALVHLGLDNPVLIDKTVRELITMSVDAILCMDDAVANNVLKTLRELHVKVPGDVKVASFYNGLLLENHLPAITALSFNARELGMVACRTILDVIEGVEVPQRNLLSYEVVMKESTQ